MAFILGRKIGMTQVYEEDGKVIPVTLIAAGPVTVTQIRTMEIDGYDAIQVGYEDTKKSKKPQKGHTKKADVEKKVLREFRSSIDNFNLGDTLDTSSFSIGDKVRVTGISKAKGFQGPVKLHNFRGAPASHGHSSVLRSGGSVGQRFPQHSLKGLRMAARMGGERTTTRGLKIVVVDSKANTIAVKGAVPGRRGTLVEIETL